VYAEIDYGPDRAGERRRTIDSLTAQKIDAEWVLVGCQRTPLGRWPVPGPLDPAARTCAGRLPGEVPTAPGLAADRARDEKQLRALYGRMLGHWLDAPSYAECFTPEADYITGGGKLERGWQENVDGHSIIFSAWARNSRLEGAVDRVHFLTCDVAVLVAHGHIVYLDDRADSTDAGKRTVYLLTAQKLDGSWIFIGYQNTPIRAL
jgi:uncharacterized protein (TIGR02246 family)